MVCSWWRYQGDHGALPAAATKATTVRISSLRSLNPLLAFSEVNVAATAAAKTGVELSVAATRAITACKSTLYSRKAPLDLSEIDMATAKVVATAASRAVASGRELQHLPLLKLGGIPHDKYGMTTLSVREYIVEHLPQARPRQESGPQAADRRP